MQLEALVEHIATEPSSVGVFFDFDGVLSSIQNDPASVTPTVGVVDAIETFARHLGAVAIVSGRPVSFLEQFFDSGKVTLSGLYGIETVADGVLCVDAESAEWEPVIGEVVESARAQFGDAVVEDKRFSVTLHYRNSEADVGSLVETWAHDIANESGLELRGAKMSIELHPPNHRSKGDAVEELLDGARVAAYFGDDVGDLPAFERLQSLVSSGSLDAAARVLVSSDETPEAMIANATVTIDGPDAVAAIMQQIASLFD